MEQKYFPIKTATACQLKWNWSTIRLYDGTTSSCHRVDSDLLTPETFQNFHNTPKKLADRQLMLQGDWPQGGCEYCKVIEDAGGSSDRMFHTSIPNMAPPELETTPTATKVTPQIVEVYFDNVCNMKCLYCWDGFSSQIHAENLKFGRFEKQGVVIDNSAKLLDNTKKELTENFWQWMTANHDKIKRFHVLGGEPFYQEQFDTCLEFLKEHPSPELELNIVSNLKVTRHKLEKILDTIHDLVKQSKIKRFDLTASIDCFGPEQEYVRSGIDVQQWMENFKLVADQSWITLNINQTLTCLTIKTVPELLKFINKLRAQREIGHYFSTVVMTHECLHPGIFGSGFFSADFDAILAEMPSDTWQQQEARKYMLGIKSQIDSCERSDTKIEQLVVFLDEMDRRRNSNWKQVFPWIKKEIQYVV
jgi:organic radical activating enzyme